MTTKIITGTYAGGYYLSPPITVLSITGAGSIGGIGVYTPLTSPGAYKIVNDGTITGTTSGIHLENGGQVTNGAPTQPGAVIDGGGNGYGIDIGGAAGAVANYGVIAVSGEMTGSAAVLLSAGGRVTNGALEDTGAYLSGSSGVVLGGGPGDSVMNFGFIVAQGTTTMIAGVLLAQGGAVVNGAVGDTAAGIIGYCGVLMQGASRGTVTNFGRILGDQEAGVEVDGAGGAVINGGVQDTVAVIAGPDGVLGDLATVTNFGTIVGGASVIPLSALPDYGVRLYEKSVVTNGSTSDRVAEIEGAGGLYLRYDCQGVNFGTIVGSETTGAILLYQSSLTNAVGATIQGWEGAYVAGALTNFGTIAGSGGTAVHVGAAGVLTVEAGSVFKGAVTGGGGALDLGAGTGTISGLASGDLTLSGFMPATTAFTGFGTVDVGAAADFVLAGNATIADSALIDAGTVSAVGTIAVADSLVVSGALVGAGALSLKPGGQVAFDAGVRFTLPHVSLSSPTEAVTVGASLTYAGAWIQSAGSLVVAAGQKLTFTGAADRFSGVIAGPGTVAFTSGADTLSALALSAITTIGAAKVTLSGAVALAADLTVTAAGLSVAAAGATVSGTGELILATTAANGLEGASGAARLTDDGTIAGSGDLGGGRLILAVGAAGAVEGTGALTVDTGASTITNVGVIEASGPGGTIVKSAIANSGKLYADGGTLTLEGAVTGSGVGTITSGTLFAASSFEENVTFGGSAGILELAHSQTYGGKITGFSKTGATSLDLVDIAFSAGTTTAAYGGTAVSGTLTVTDGTHTARIKLSGNYVGSAFDLSSDGHGGTLVVDPTSPPAAHGIRPAPLQTFVAAMAIFGAAEGAAPARAGAADPIILPQLATAAPRTAFHGEIP